MEQTPVIHPTTISPVPKQTAARMEPMSFRVPAEVKEQGYAKAARLGVNPTAVMRDLWTAWAQEGDES